MTLLVLLTATVFFVGLCQSDEQVSFYGASYIHFPLQEAKGATDLSFRFRTQWPDAMLILAAGKTDYCLIKLDAGRLKVHINLGAGESEIASTYGLTLNDLRWHEVNLTRRDANITLQIDVIHTTKYILPGRFFELNIHFGVYIGGQGNFNELFLGHTEYLRGCMASIIYNGANVIEYAKARRNKAEAVSVSWGCSREFEATRATEISFVEVGAFISIGRPILRFGFRWECELKTAEKSGMLLYNAIHTSNSNYLGIELNEGRIHVVINKGNGPSELIHPNIVGDGEWHNVSVNCNQNTIEINIDNQSKRLNLPLSGNRYLDPGEVLYIGGIELNKRTRAIGKGLKTGDQSYNGCLRNIIFNGRPIGPPDIKVSQGIVVGCVWKYPCLMRKKLCGQDATCDQFGVSGFKCMCKQPIGSSCTTTDDYTDMDDVAVNVNAVLPVNLEIVSLSQLEVHEGKFERVTSKNIEMILDLAKYGMSDNSVSFTIVFAPKRGALYCETVLIKTNSSFTLRDLNQKKIQYIHDGSESTEDTIILELKLRSDMGHALPRYLQGRLGFPLRVNVTPVNDQPVLDIPATNILRLAQGTRKTLSTQLISTFDADTPSDMLTYSVLRTDKDAGYVERSDEQGRRVETFTQAELERGTIAYVHRGIAQTDATLGLRVSDGASTSRSRYLKISTYPLKIMVKRNTGLVVVHNSFSHLSSSNISLSTNSDDSTIDLRFDIVKSPDYGVIQMSREDTKDAIWETVHRFNSNDVDSKRVRYLHTRENPTVDEFEFRASLRAVKPEKTYNFLITFIHMEFTEIKRQSINFTNSTEIRITSRSLSVQTKPLVTLPKNIGYKVTSMPKYGNLMIDNKIIGNGDEFTQEDVDFERLSYRLFKKSYSSIDEKIGFAIDAPQCQRITSNISIEYRTVGNVKSSKFVEHATVVEGSKIPLTIIFTRIKNIGQTRRLIFNITEGPDNGWLTLRRSSDGKIIRPNVTYFVTDELVDGNVYYNHDDSETTKDHIIFVATSVDQTDFMYVGRLNVDVVMQNDNRPDKTMDKIFYVISNGQRIITDNDLCYTDKDIGTRPVDIVYTIKNVTNGMINRVDDSAIVIDKFTQQDVNNGKILFRHRGENVGKFEFVVSDGRWFVKGKLVIEASRPSIRFRKNVATIVGRFNASITLGLREIDVETNIHVADDKAVNFVVVRQPTYGMITKHLKKTYNFTREQLARGYVGYEHFGNSLSADDVEIRVAISSVASSTNVQRFVIDVYPENYWQSLTVINNKSIYVEETTSVSVTRDNLEIVLTNVTASKIVYHVREWPKNGYIEVQNNAGGGEGREGQFSKDDDDDDDANLVQRFDQRMINEGRVYYVQSVSNQTRDRFVVDATNGVTWSRGLVVNFFIVPDRIYVETTNLKVVEGKTVVLTVKNFRITNNYLNDETMNYEIICKPKHGIVVELTENREIENFSQRLLTDEVVAYEHNGDESPGDELKLVIIAGNKTSQTVVLSIDVEPINDEIPVLVNRSIDYVWQGGSVTLTPEKLATVDNDTNPDQLNYHVTNITNGYLWHVGSPDIHIYNFTQAEIDRSDIVFTHTNGSDAIITFILFDGVHVTNKYEVPVTTLPVNLHIERNNLFEVFPLTRKPISNVKLLTVCSDPPRNVRYIVREPPKLGTIVMEIGQGNWHRVDDFTQKDVNSSRVMYEHTKPFMDLSTNDSFVFDVEAQFADAIANQVFRIDVSVSSGALNRHVSSRTVHVEEGRSAPVMMNLAGIVKYLRMNVGIEKPTVLVELLNQPNHGLVTLLPDSNSTTFTQSQIEGKKIEYRHDDSDTTDDKIQFSIVLSPGHVILCNASVSVSIKPINDEPFKLVTTEPSITIVQNQTQTITREDLLTLDPDTNPEDLVYHLISGPNNGRLLIAGERSDSSTQPAIYQQVDEWTQRDVNDNRLIYQHNGTTQTSTFHFRVSDRRFNPVYNVFTINVLPIKLELSSFKPVSLLQGSSIAYVSQENIKLDTNARSDNVYYEVTRLPIYGNLCVRNVVSRKFKQIDLSGKSLTYVQTDMTVSNDSFEISARVSNVEPINLIVNVRVEPFIITKLMNVYAGKNNLITKKYLDATPLYETTHSNPVFRLTRSSKYCKIKRIIRRSGEKKGSREREVSRFTHLEIISRVMFLVCRQFTTPEVHPIVSDSFEFRVSTPSCQPASGIFELTIKTGTDDVTGFPSVTTDSINRDDRMIASRNTNDDYIIFYGVIPSFLIVAVILVITIKCRQKRYKDNAENKRSEIMTSAIGIIPLPRPPDHLIPANRVVKNFDPDNFNVMASTPIPVQSSTIGSTLPQCKVIPLSGIDNSATTGSEPDNSGKYPSGVADCEEWNSYDTGDVSSQTATTERTNPLLQKNQYWV